jgi:hypothetical protein
MIHVRITSTYPPVFGLPEETIELTIRLPAEFARTADEAHERILEALKRDEEFEIPSMDAAIPFEFSPDVVRSVAVWEEGGPAKTEG